MTIGSLCRTWLIILYRIFFTVWAAALGDESQTADYFVSGQIISSAGEKLGETIDILKTEDIVMLPRVLYNPNKNQYLVIYCLGLNYFNIHGVVLDEQGESCWRTFQNCRCACQSVPLYPGF
jgi:hypothetical protein